MFEKSQIKENAKRENVKQEKKVILNHFQQDVLNTFFESGLCFVNASAGTGKTSTIVEAYISLLKMGVAVSSIVMITFTKAAASELLMRIRIRIQEEIKNSEEKNNSEEKKKFEAIYSDIINKNNISTIHSFAQKIVRDNSLTLSMPANISILEENEDFNKTINKKIETMLLSSKEGKLLHSTFRLYLQDEKELFIENIKTFLNMIKPRLENTENLKKSISSILDDKTDYREITEEIKKLSKYLLAYNANQVTIQNIKEFINQVLILLEKYKTEKLIEEENEELFILFFNSVEKLSEQKTGRLKKESDFTDSFEVFREVVKKLKTKIINIYYKKYLLNFLDFTLNVYSEIEKLKTKSGVYSYEDIVSKAMEALTNKVILESIRKNIKAIILDEAQDTSRLQFHFINMLAFGESEPTKEKIEKETKERRKKLLMVGDRKQSIYRFRNADVNAFLKVQNMFSESVKFLKINYRSSKMLIEFFNNFFFHTLFNNDALKYTESDNLETDKTDTEKSVMYLLLNHNTKEGEKIIKEEQVSLEAYTASYYIKNNYTNSYKDITILLPNFTRLTTYLNALSSFQIPFYVDGGNGFFEREEIENISDFLFYLVLHEENLITKILTYPFFNISINTIYNISNELKTAGLTLDDYFSIHKKDSENYKKAENIILKKEYKNKSYGEEVKKIEKIEEIKNIINSLQKISTLTTSSELIETICKKTNYYYYSALKDDAELTISNIEKLKRISLDYEHQTGKNVYDFALYIKNSKNSRMPYSSVSKLVIDAVKIMTIHGSKGLEFERVFALGLNSSTSTRTANFDFIDEKPVIKIKTPLNTVTFTNAESDEDKEKNLSEKRRLLYVALTRASKNLILAGEKKDKNSYREYFDTHIENLNKESVKENIKETTEDMPSVMPYENINDSNLEALVFGKKIKEIANIKEEEIIKENKKYLEEVVIKEIEKHSKESPEIKEKIKPKKIINIRASIKKEISENDYINSINSLLNTKTTYFEESGGLIEEYEVENIKEMTYIDIGTVIHYILEVFDFNLYSKEKENYINTVILNTVKNMHYSNTEEIKETIETAIKLFLKNKHIENIINGSEKIIARENQYQKLFEDAEKNICLLKGKIDLITEDKNGNLFIIDYKTAKQKKDNDLFTYFDKENIYENQMNIYKSLVSEVYNKKEEEIFTEIIYLKK